MTPKPKLEGIHIEHWPFNLDKEHVVVLELSDGGRLSFAYPTRERAEEKLPELAHGWGR